MSHHFLTSGDADRNLHISTFDTIDKGIGNCAVNLFMDDELKIDASGCWVRKKAQESSESQLGSQSDSFNGLASSVYAKEDVDIAEKDETLIVW